MLENQVRVDIVNCQSSSSSAATRVQADSQVVALNTVGTKSIIRRQSCDFNNTVGTKSIIRRQSCDFKNNMSPRVRARGEVK